MERVLLWFKGEISVCAARPNPTRPDPMTLLRSLYLWNGLTDSRAVFFVRCHHSINSVFDLHRYPPVPATARGTCRVRGCRRHPTSVTPRPLARLRSNLVCAYGPAGYYFYTCLRWSASARAHVHTLFHMSRTAGRSAFKFCVTSDPLDDSCFTQVWGGVHLHVRTCTPLFHISQTAGMIAFKFGVWLRIH